MMRIGHGYDVHQLVTGRPLVIGGVRIEHTRGLLGHSDADVLLHAICDACLGAAGLGDVGKHFPDTDKQYKDIDSRVLLRRVADELKQRSWKAVNVDSTVVVQAPKLVSYIPQMIANIAEDLGIAAGAINVKATTTEHLSFPGRGEGIAAYAVVLLEK